MLLLLVALLSFAAERPVRLWWSERIGDDSKVFQPPLAERGAFGAAVGALGDIDGDGTTDLAVGAPGDAGGGTQRGAIRILFLHAEGQARSSVRIDGDTGPLAGRIADFDAFGSALVSPGDVDGDGVPDLVVGAPFAEGEDEGHLVNRGAAWLLFLTAEGEPRDVVRIALDPQEQETSLPSGSWFGSALAAPGDVDGDGVPDLVVGAPGDEGRDGLGGSVWLLFLNRDGTARGARRIAVGDEDPAAVPGRRGLGFGTALAFLGGPDRRGFRRLAVGAPGAYTRGRRTGEVTLLRLGPEGGVRARTAIAPGAGMAARLRGGDSFGCSLASPGDYDGDGADLFVGLAGFDAAGKAVDSGAIWLIRIDIHDRVISFQPFTVGQEGKRGQLSPFDRFGSALAAPGDLDGNGVPDLVIGAPGDSTTGTRHGAIWIHRFVHCAPGAMAVRRAPGQERVRLTMDEVPRLGKPCVLQLDCSDHAPNKYGLVISRQPTELKLRRGGVLLVSLLEADRLGITTGPHEGDTVQLTIRVPDLQAYCGLTLFAQAAILGEPGIELTNAVDVLIGD